MRDDDLAPHLRETVEDLAGESAAIRALNWKLHTVQAQIADAKRIRDNQQRRIAQLTRTRSELWRERRVQRQREQKAQR